LILNFNFLSVIKSAVIYEWHDVIIENIDLEVIGVMSNCFEVVESILSNSS